MLLVVNTTLTVYSWIAIIVLTILAVIYWIRFFWPNTILHISERGICHHGNEDKWIKWEDIQHFSTVVYKDNESGNTTHLLLKTRQRFMNINIDLTELHINKTQIREWIKTYAGPHHPVDKGHDAS